MDFSFLVLFLREKLYSFNIIYGVDFRVFVDAFCEAREFLFINITDF